MTWLVHMHIQSGYSSHLNVGILELRRDAPHVEVTGNAQTPGDKGLKIPHTVRCWPRLSPGDWSRFLASPTNSLFQDLLCPKVANGLATKALP